MAKPPRIYIDAPPLIDAAKHEVNLSLGTQRQNEQAYFKMILEAARDGEIEALTSTLTVVECLTAKGIMDDRVKDLFKRLLTSGQYLRLVTPDPFVAERGRDLRWVHGINLESRGADYLHVASALHVNCTEFVTFDGPIRKQSAKLNPLGLRVVNPSESTALTDERKQLLLPGVSPHVVPIRGRRKRAKK